jgi:predicted transglutaminase-like cysteine proteinase
MRLLLILAMTLTSQPLLAAAFGSSEIARNRLGGFPKWASMVERQNVPESSLAPPSGTTVLPDGGGCIPNPRFACPGERVATFVASQQSAPRGAQLDAINRFFNAQPYITDIRNWGVPDYWATIREFLKKDGDCEDYAIAKYTVLKQLGWQVDDLRIIIVQDENLNVPHAVLTVKLDNRIFVLDNQIQEVLPDTAIVHYRPFYSLNDAGFWVHVARAR